MLQRELEHNPSVKTDAAAAFLASLEDPKLTTLGEAVKKPPIEILPPGMASLSAPPITIKKKPGALPAPAQNPNSSGTPIGAQNTSSNPVGTPIGAQSTNTNPIATPNGAQSTSTNPIEIPNGASTTELTAAPENKDKVKPLMLEGPKDERTANSDEQAQDTAKTDEVVAKSEPASEAIDAPKDGSVKNENSVGGSNESEVLTPLEEKKAVEETKPAEAVTPV
jgi:hypothetical protein